MSDTNERPVEIKVFASGDGNATTCSMETIRNFLKQVIEIENEIKELKQKTKDLTKDFCEEHGLPKKEIDMARKMLKMDIDPDTASEIYANIADLVR